MSSQRQVLDLVDAMAERPFQITGGYPKVHAIRLGPRAARALQRRAAKGYRLSAKPKPATAGARPNPGRELRRVHVSDHAPWKKEVHYLRLRPFERLVPLADVATLAVLMVAATALIRVIGAHWTMSTATNMYMLLCFCGYAVLYLGGITAARQAIKRAAGVRWRRDAVEYVPGLNVRPGIQPGRILRLSLSQKPSALASRPTQTPEPIASLHSMLTTSSTRSRGVSPACCSYATPTARKTRTHGPNVPSCSTSAVPPCCRALSPSTTITSRSSGPDKTPRSCRPGNARTPRPPPTWRRQLLARS